MDPYLAQILPVGFSFVQQGWNPCDGRLLSISENTALFSLLGTTFGGDGVTTFALPDLRGRCIVGTGQGPGLTNIDLGEVSGVESVTLITSQMPIHNHSCTATSVLNGLRAAPSASNPSGNVVAGANMYLPPTDPPTSVQMATDAIATTVTLAVTGQSLPMEIRNPYLGINYQICVEGIYPSRP